MSNAPDSARRTLLLIVAVFLAPVVAAYAIYFVIKPSGGSYGELLKPQQLAPGAFRTIDGQRFEFAGLHGKWVLLAVDRGGCDRLCLDKIHTLRQVRLMQRGEQSRIERVWLATSLLDSPAVPLEDRAGLMMVESQEASWLRQLPADSSPEAHIYLIDPRGYLILRYPAQPDVARMSKDIKKLLKASLIG